MHKPAAIYTRVSSDRQKEDHTIASQTAALIEYAQTQGYAVPPEWIFQDEGYSGATLVRPGLEALRDLSAEGQITAVLVYSPDRLSRKYAYQVLLTEELSRCGVEVIFLKAPTGATPEDQLVVQFQGMIAEYERAQIAERSRRGKRHKAQQGVVNVLSGAPYGYRYVKKNDHSAAYYEVIDHEAQVVQMVFETYTRRHLSINAIARLLNEQRIPTRTEKTRWERSTVWAMLRNPAYQGKACYGKTELQPRQRITRPLRQRNRLPNRNSANHERPAARMDRGGGTRGGDGGGICAGTRAVREEQAFFSSAHEEADVTPGDAGVPTMRLCHVSVFRREIPPKIRLLPVHWLGWLPPAQWPAVYQPPCSAGSPRRNCLGTGHSFAGRWDANPI